MFWDSSAVVPLLVTEQHSESFTRDLAADTEPAIWWATPLEVHSAVHRRHRERPFPTAELTAHIDRLRQIVQHADIIAPTDDLRHRAARLLALHPLRAADALQLAAALIWAEEQPHGERFVCLDARLRDAAMREDFTLVPAEL